jgi:glyoxylase I family protein
MKTDGIHHIAIICSNYDRSKQFYTQVLGFSILAETYRAERQSYKLDLRISETVAIELFSFPNPPDRPSRPEACGLRHLAFAVTEPQRLTETA